MRELRRLDDRHHFTLVCSEFAQLGEYERTATVAANAFVGARMSGWVVQSLDIRARSAMLLAHDPRGRWEALAASRAALYSDVATAVER